jgi:putative RNA 2'-phosphotransferase
MSSGLQKMNRQYVHLSVDNDTAWTVGTRHGEAIVFQVDAHQMYIDGFLFYQAENGVWLTDNVPAKYLTLTNM